MAPISNTQRQREFVARRQAEGYRLLREWVHADDVARVKAYIAKLAKARDKGKA